MSGNTRKNQVTRLVTLRHQSTMSGALELTHWFETIYKDAGWARMMKEVEGHYHSWLKEEKLLVRLEVLGNARRLLKDRAVLSNWVRETHADCGAYDYAGALLQRSAAGSRETR
jgi:hypothetical protein